MADFIETSKSRNAKRTYDKIADVDTFEAAVSAFEADSTMGLTRKEASSEVYKTRIDYFDAKGEKGCHISVCGLVCCIEVEVSLILTFRIEVVDSGLIDLRACFLAGETHK